MLGRSLGQEWRVHLGLGTKAQMHTPLFGHVGAMLGLCWPMLLHVGLLGGHVGAMLSLCWAKNNVFS